ncbi:TPA: hypothetical protein ACOEGY_000912 [Enterobacter bugandensis]
MDFAATVKGRAGNVVVVDAVAGVRDAGNPAEVATTAVWDATSLKLTITLGCDESGKLTATPAEVVTAVSAVADVKVTAKGTGSGIVTPFNLQLSGGEDEPFPLNTPVAIVGTTMLSRLGEKGSLKPALTEINDQRNALTVVVRVAEDADAAKQRAAVLAGIGALSLAKSVTTFQPRNGYWGNWTNVLTNYGGDVDHLSNASYYHINPTAWPGVGAFAAQYSNPVAPFIIPFGRVTPKGQSQYLPIIKGLSSTEEYGFGAAVSFGILRSGNNDFGSAVIHIIGDNGKSAMLSFDTDGLFAVPSQFYSGGTIVSEGDITAKGGNIHAAGQVDCGGNIVAGQGLYESGGLVRVYSSNNPPPQQDLSPYATTGWVSGNFITDIGLGAQGSGVIPGGGSFIVPSGCVMTGWYTEGNTPGGDTIFYRQIMKYIPSVGWVGCGNIA